MAKSKSMTGKEGGRKLATDHGRARQKSGGEPQKQGRTSGKKVGGASRRTASAKQRKS